MVLFSACYESRVFKEVVIVIISNVGSCHVLMLHTVKTFSDLTTLDPANIGQHGVRSKVPDTRKKIKSMIEIMKMKTTYPLVMLSVDRAAVW